MTEWDEDSLQAALAEALEEKGIFTAYHCANMLSIFLSYQLLYAVISGSTLQLQIFSQRKQLSTDCSYCTETITLNSVRSS